MIYTGMTTPSTTARIMRDITIAETPPTIPAMFQPRAFLLYSTAAV